MEVGSGNLHDRIAAVAAAGAAPVLTLRHDDSPEFVSATNVLQTSINPMDAMLHVPGWS